MTRFEAGKRPAITMGRHGAWIIAAIMLAAAFVLRGRYFGLPQIHVDEQFYLLVGDRMLHDGAIPYVDIWDRKPAGLFLLYAGIRLLGGNGIVEYQIVASFFAAGTAILIALWSQRFAGRVPAVLAGLFYLAFIHKFNGYGGQAEVFVNLLTIGAAFLIAPFFQEGTAGRHVLRAGCAAMLLSGLAIQLKPTAVFPGFFLGLALIWLGYRQGWKLGRIALAALLWAGVALLPTVLIVLWYAAHGYLDDFLFANVYSVAMRRDAGSEVLLQRLQSQFLSVGLPLFGGLLLFWWQGNLRANGRWKPPSIFLLWWTVGGLAAFLSVGTFYNHYALIVVPMICVLLGAVARPRGTGWIAIAGMAALAVYVLAADQKRVLDRRSEAVQVYRVANLISANLNGGCLYVHRGLPIYYHLTHACLPTRFPFTYHLSLDLERDALGVDPVGEVARILATRPTVIVYDDVEGADAVLNRENPDTAALVHQVLAKDYRPIAENAPPGAPEHTVYKLIERRDRR